MNLFITDTAQAPAAATASTDARTDAPATVAAELAPVAPTLLQRLGGGALIVAPLLLTAGMLTSPEQTGPGTAGYIESLAADPALSLWSANLLHYGWVALAIGAVSTLGLLRGRRGRMFLPLAVAILVFGAIQMSGLLLSDWFLASAGNVLPIELAVTMDQTAKEWTAAVWQYTGMVGGLLGIGLLSLALARAGAISWWIAPLAFLPWVLPAFGLGPVGVIAALACYAPLLIAGGRLALAR